MVREWVIDSYDGFEGLRLQKCEKEQPAGSDVRLAIEAFALNWGDADLMLDGYSFSFPSLPARIGIEAAGVVEAVGPDVTAVKVGERCATLPYFYDMRGTSAETVLIDQAYLTNSPANLSPVEAASVWMQYMTAYFPIVELAGAAPGKTIFIPAGTSTAGNAGIQIAKMKGATVVSTTRSSGNVDYIRAAGADHVFVDDGSDIEAYLRDVTDGIGVNASFDPVGGDFMERYANALAKGGHIYLYGGLTGSYSNPPFLAMIQNSLWFHAYSLFNYVEDTEAKERGLAFVHSALANGQLKPHVDRVFPMEDLVKAWRYMRSDRTSFGKVVIKTGI